MRVANLEKADLTGVNFQGAILAGVNLSGAILLSVDLRSVQGLTPEQLKGENPPLICNALLPSTIQIPDWQDRDCERLADALLQRKLYRPFYSREEVEKFILEQRQKTFD
ncbi:MAG: pentapeptide repeat-containing protein [Cyanobacteria bacterium P01_D01_bin.156]